MRREEAFTLLGDGSKRWLGLFSDATEEAMAAALGLDPDDGPSEES